MSAQSAPKTDRVTLGLSEGREVEGFLGRFTPLNPQLTFRRADDGVEQVIPRNKVDYVGFHRLPGQSPSPTNPGMTPLRVQTPSGREFLIMTQLGTHGSHWFHGYPIDPDSLFHRIFFFRHGVRHKERLEPLGSILVGEGMVASEEVDRAVETQKSDRETPLGEILVEQRKVEASHIEQAMTIQARKRIKLGEVLIEEGLVEQADIDAALAEQQRRRGRKLGDILIERGAVDEFSLLAALGVKFDLPFVDLEDYPVQLQAHSAIPLPIQRRYGIVPIARDDRSLTLAISDPLATEAHDIVQSMVDLELREVLATQAQIQELIEQGGAAPTAIAEEEGAAAMVRAVLQQALERGAEAVHWLPGSAGLRVACRIKGGWQHLEPIDRARQGQVLTALLAWAEMERLDPCHPQEGLLPLTEETVFRVSTLPGPMGPSVVLEPLPPFEVHGLEQLGLSAAEAGQLREGLSKPGLLVVAGPKGAGRTATLEALLAEVVGAQRHALLLTESLRVPVQGVDVCRVPADMTPLAALQAALRHAPDALALTLPLDVTTAEAALAAARTMPVLLKVEAGSVAEAIARLRRLGLSSPAIAAVLHGVVAQRRADRLCPECRVAVPVDDDLRVLIKGRGLEGEGALFRNGAGCPACSGGERVVVAEMLVGDEAVRRAIAQEVAGEELEAVACAAGMTALSERLLALVRAGEVEAEALLS